MAVLVPTTLLAQQHYNSFRDRFADWPVTVEVMSRFKSAKEVANAAADLAEGKIDILIGTHKLLQDDVRFKDWARPSSTKNTALACARRNSSRPCAARWTSSPSPPRRSRAR